LTGSEVGDLWNAAVVPEPSSIIMIGFGGLVGLALVGRRRGLRK
jgi:hypothetical protein